MALGLQPHAHNAVKHQRQKADQRMGADAVGQPMMDRRNLDVGFQHPESALDIGQRLVAGNGLGGAQIGGVGDQRKLAVEEYGV